MPAGRYFRVLTAFDLLGNFIPGTVLFTVLLVMLPSPPFPASPGEYLLAGIVAFSLGHFVQRYAAYATGNRRTFVETMDAARRLPDAKDDAADANGDESAGDAGRVARARRACAGLANHCWLAFGMPVPWWRQDRGSALGDELLANRVWKQLLNTYGIDRGTDNYGALFRMMSSEVEDIDVPSRAPRFQAIRNFHRGMWVVSWTVFVVLFALAVAVNLVGVGDQLLGTTIRRPAVFEYWRSELQLLVAVGSATVGFWYLADDYEREFIEYLFTDYVVVTTNDEPDVNVTVNVDEETGD